MRHEPINPELFIENRKQFALRMENSSVAVFNSNDTMPTSADGTLPFVQHSDIFYLTGIDQEETILLLNPHSPQEHNREILFVRETNEHLAVWEGEKLTKMRATQISGIKNVQWLSAFQSQFRGAVLQSNNIYLNTNEFKNIATPVQMRDDRFREQCMSQYPLHTYKRSAPILHELRAIKSDIEVALIRQACTITEKGFRRILKYVKPGVYEYEIEAEFAHEFLKNRSRGFAYQPIIASGKDSCILHYVKNDKICQDGDVLCLDVGAEYAGYNADMTRTIPVNGKFTQRQRNVYDAVLRVLRQASALLTVGSNFEEFNKAVGEIMTEELIGLKLLKRKDVRNQNPERPLYKKYFMHGTSHHLGLNVHDYGHYGVPFAAGMVFTVEPGIYIPEESIGIRLENDIVITQSGFIDLMGSIPIEPDEIEQLMNKRKK